MGTKEQRIYLLKGMNHYITNLGDEEIYETWLSYGIPDEPTEEDYDFIAGNIEEWVSVCQLFNRLIQECEEKYEE